MNTALALLTISKTVGVLAFVSIGVGECAQAGVHEHAERPEGAASSTAGSPDDRSPRSSDSHSAHKGVAAPSGYSSIAVDLGKLGALGFATTRVEHRNLTRMLRTVGVLTLDETRTSHVHAKVRGTIEGVQVDFVGKSVKRGESLCAIYSQAVLAAQLEFVTLLKQRQVASTPKNSVLEVDQPWNAIVDAARRRMTLWDVPRSQVDKLEQTLEPTRTFALAAPRAGIVVNRGAFVGNYVEPGTELYVISDLSSLWVQLDVYEADVPHVTLEQSAKLTIEGVTDPITGRIAFLAPTIDEATRTLKARLVVDNRAGLLRPGAFVSAELSLPVGHGLVVPEGAVIRTGLRNIVYVAHGGHVEPREVRLGPLVAGFYRVDAGLTEGDRVVSGAQFLIDSESRLRATSSPGAGHAGH